MSACALALTIVALRSSSLWQRESLPKSHSASLERIFSGRQVSESEQQQQVRADDCCESDEKSSSQTSPLEVEAALTIDCCSAASFLHLRPQLDVRVKVREKVEKVEKIFHSLRWSLCKLAS